jgi:homoserine O-succinyltransferase
MSILLHPDLPASRRVAAKDVAPLRIALVNLMPNKKQTETQFTRVLTGCRLSIELTLVLPDSYQPTHTAPDHLRYSYRRFSQIAGDRFDGVIVTGAPVEKLAFEEVNYWAELKRLFDWARDYAQSTFAVCWAGQAALNHFYGVPKHLLPEKEFGVFSHQVLRPNSALMRGVGREFPVPVSRYTEIRREDLPRNAGLEVLAESAQTGLCLIADRELRLICMFNHLEYDAGTLRDEWLRDQSLGRPANPPANYFPNDDLQLEPIDVWKPVADRLFSNWLNVLCRPGTEARRRSLPRRQSHRSSAMDLAACD